MTISNIDDLLMSGTGNSQQPATPEHQDAPEEIEEVETSEPEYADDEPESEPQ